MQPAKKQQHIFICSECGYESRKWLGRCPDCGSWDSLSEQQPKSSPRLGRKAATAQPLTQAVAEEQERLRTQINEMDRVLGGGIVPGSLVLIGGDPGIGKSTLILQLLASLARQECPTLYVTGEESARQIRMRADRLHIHEASIAVSTENCVEAIIDLALQTRPALLAVDSIQTVFSEEIGSAPGSVTQVRESTARLLHLAKENHIPILLVGHVTKDGAIAGPRVLEHMVDTVLYFEGDRGQVFRILRTVKNRFGSTNEIGIFEMSNKGLEEVSNPSKIFLSSMATEATGSVIIPTLEGTRTVLVEMQCLVSQTNFNMARRMAVGIDYNKLVLLTAVLEKKAGMVLYNQDIYLNVVGGMSIDEPAADLAVVMAVASSFREIAIPDDMIIFGEVGLTGEIRSVNQVQQRINEGAKMGFKKAIIPHGNLEGIERPKDFTVIGMKHIDDVFKYFF